MLPGASRVLGNNMFMGEYTPSLDEKGRVAVPAKLRRAFGDTLVDRLVLTRGFDKCIMAFRVSDWQDFVENTLLKLPQSDPVNRKRLRFLIGGATEVDLDRQGRILLPGWLMEYAELADDVVIIGLYNRIEIWSRQVYDGEQPCMNERDLFAAEIGF